MRTATISRGMLASLALLATVITIGCGASQAPNGAGPGNGQTTAPTASPTQSASAPAGKPSATPATSGGIRNLAISSAERSRLTAAFVAHKGISLSDVLGAGPLPGSVYYAYDPATGTYWALAEFHPSSTASEMVQVGFQDGGNYGMYRKAGAGPWQVRTPGWPPVCTEVEFFPLTVLRAWALPTSTPPGESGCGA